MYGVVGDGGQQQAGRRMGHCHGCDTWVPRDEMLSINLAVFDAANMESRIRLRLCPACHAAVVDRYRPWNWTNHRDLRKYGSLQADPVGERGSGALSPDEDEDVDDGEAAMRAAGRPIPEPIKEMR